MEEKHKETRFEFGKLELEPGDILGMKVIGRNVTREEAERIKKQLEEALPGVKIFVYHKDEVELSIIRAVDTLSAP
jgi:superfamily II DNA helicase RecQ